MVFAREIGAVAKKEILDNIRSKWVVVLSFIFALLTVVVSYFGSLGSDWQSLDLTIAGMMSLVEFLVSIIGLMLGYAAINGEMESGELLGVLALPLKRLELLLGKFFGLGVVLSSSVLIGFGIGGLIIALNVSGSVDWLMFLGFIGSSVLYGLVFLALALLWSVVLRRRSASMGLSVFTWFFFTMIWGIIVLGILMGEMLSSSSFQMPDWYFVVNLLNPMQVYVSLVSLVVPGAAAQSSVVPEWYSSGLLVVVLVVWIVGCLSLAIWRFNRRDV